MEKYGLSMEELGAQRTELLPDRIEMRRRRRRGVRQTCQGANLAVVAVTQLNINQCFVQQA